MAEFAYNNSINKPIGMSPFEAVTGIPPHLPIDLVPLPIEMRLSIDANDFIRHMQQVHDEVHCNITTSNEIYKQHIDARHHPVEFKEGDIVMVRIWFERLPLGSSKKLHPHNASPFKILKKISVNAYVLDLPLDLAISPTFNVEDLTIYHVHFADEGNEEQDITLPAIPLAKDTITDVLDD